jgi:AcrR family transcriptional regulator
MPANPKAVDRKKASFIEQHRRAQIIETAINTIATQGYVQASLANIARAAGISKGVISYYFKGKDDLIDQIKTHLLMEMGTFVRDRVEARRGDAEKLRAYVDASFDYIQENRTKFVVMLELGINLQSDDFGNPFSAINYQACRYRLEKILHDGHINGSFHLADIRTMAVAIQGMLDGISIQWVAEPDAIDLNQCRREAANMIAAYLGLSA